jgi:hypothetical protein
VLSIFRTNQLFASILLVFYVVLLRSSAFVLGEFPIPEGKGILTQWIYEWVGHNSTTAIIVAMVLLVLQSFYINVLASEHRLASEVSLFPGLFYVLIGSFLPEFNYLSPTLIGNTFFIIAYGELLATYKRLAVADRIFNVGFWIGVGTLCYPSYLVLMIFGFAGLNILRGLKIKERLMIILGFITPFILLGTYYFWMNTFPDFIAYLTDGFQVLSFSSTPLPLAYRSLGIFAIFLLVVNFSYRSYLFKRTMEVQRKINILFWGLLACSATLLFQSEIDISHLAILAFPLGMMLSINFINMPSRMAEVIHLLLLAIALGLQFQAWLL